MKPDFRILADLQDITARIRDRLLSLRITDEAGIQSDTVEILLDDRDGRIEWPAHGVELEVFLGDGRSGLSRMGLYVVDEVEHSGPPASLTIRGKAADMRAAIKAPRTRSWHDLSLGDLVATIATEHGLSPRVAESLAGIHVTHLDQTEESDLHLLTRLAREHGAVAKPVAGFLVFVPRGEAKAATGRDLPTIPITATDVSRHRMTQAERGKYQAVRAWWHDPNGADRVPVLVGDGKPVYTLRHPYPDAEAATRAATAKLESLRRGNATRSLTLIGNPALQAEGKIRLTGLRDPVDGKWLLQRVEHQFDGRGFVTRIEAETPNL